MPEIFDQENVFFFPTYRPISFEMGRYVMPKLDKNSFLGQEKEREFAPQAGVWLRVSHLN